MPLHRIYTPPNFFTREEKRQLVKEITDHYSTQLGLPPFLVITLFCPIDTHDFYIGYQNHEERASDKGKPFVRIVVQHLARTMTTKQMRARGLKATEDKYRTLLEPKNCEWEIHIEEPPADLWHLSGYDYPAPRTEAEAKWKEHNEAVPYQGPTMADYLEQQHQQSQSKSAI